MVKPTAESMAEASSSTSHEPKYKGVRKRKWGKWVSEIRLPNSRERIWLGSYESPEKAARAFDAALLCLRGATAKFNFPNNRPDINITGPGGRPLYPQEIQMVAAKYANEEQERPRASLEYNVSSSEEAVVPVNEDSNSCDKSTIDWSFWSTLDSHERAVASDFGLYSGVDIAMDMNVDELYPPPTPMVDENGEDHHNVYSHSSFLWNF